MLTNVEPADARATSQTLLTSRGRVIVADRGSARLTRFSCATNHESREIGFGVGLQAGVQRGSSDTTNRSEPEAKR